VSREISPCNIPFEVVSQILGDKEKSPALSRGFSDLPEINH
jgi:hypothetical protein